MILAGLCAVGAMVLFGVAAVLQALATSRAVEVDVLDPRLLLRLAHQPVLLAALGLNGLGFATARQMARALIMPNLRPPVTTARQALDYRQRILEAVPAGLAFDPVMSLYLTDRTPPEEIARAAEAGVRALKLYPAGATTNSDAGVTDLRLAYPTLEAMQKHGLLFLVHGEVTDPAVDLFDREGRALPARAHGA